jgi:uroporphyrinogen decarboxylase
VPEALGQAFEFREKGGVKMEFGIHSSEDISRLKETGVAERLQYVSAAIRMIKLALGDTTALIGFAGSPWTLANFMLEGGSAKDFAKARHLFYSDRRLFDRLCEKLTRAVTEFLQAQIDAGVDAVQIFDSLGGLVAGNAFEEASGRWLKEIVTGLRRQVPVIVFAKGAHSSVGSLIQLGADVLGVDWTVSLGSFRQQIPKTIGVQGNLDPLLLETTPEAVELETKRIVSEMKGRPGHIFNLGHGVPPSAKLECIERLVATLRNSNEHT